MSELLPIRAFIVDDDEWKTDKIAVALATEGHLVVATATTAFDVLDLYEDGRINANQIDVAFLDSDLGSGMGGGKEVLRLLYMNGLARRPVGVNPQSEPVTPEKDKIVTVGASMDPQWACEIGSYSDISKLPLVVDWEIKPLNLAFIVSEVQRLKPRT